MATVGEQASAIANRFVAARRGASGLADYPGEPPKSLDDAYAVQDAAIEEWAKPVVGWKVGRIAPPLSELHHSDRLAGPIFTVVQTDADAPDMPVFARGFAAAEAEYVLRIGAEPPRGKIDFTLTEAADLIDSVHVGIEIASSPLGPINDLGPTAIISDFGNNNGLVIGPEIPNWRDSGFEEWEVATWIDGVEAGRGQASSFANGAIGSARFLFELMARRGISLTAGQYISSGAVTGAHDLRPGQKTEVRFDRWYRLSCRAIAAEPERASASVEGRGMESDRGATVIAPPATTGGRVRWIVVGLLFAATAINYVDRQMLGLLKPTLEKEFGWSEETYANDIVFTFQLAYAAGYIFFGNIVDRIGARLGYAAAFVIWTIAHMLHGAARSVTSFALVRLLLGVGESGNFPAGIKAITEWFPKKERAFATGLFNAGSNVGAIVTPLMLPFLVAGFGWRGAFVVSGAASLIWLVAWLALYRRPRESKILSGAELAHIEQDPPDPAAKVPWLPLLRCKETWAFALGKFLTDPVWWMFLFWLPDFLHKRHGLDLKTFGPPIAVIYIVSDLGSIGGGWLSSHLIHRGWTINAARKTTMLICALAVTPIFLAQYIDSLWGAVAIISLATAAHQAFSANIYTLPSDMFPRKAVGSVIGIGGTAGAVGGMIFSLYVGQVLERLGTYTPIFAVAGSVYLIALLIIHLLAPRFDEARIGA